MNKLVASILVGVIIIAAPATSAMAQPAQAGAGTEQAAKLTEARAIIAVIFPADQREQMFAKLQRDMVDQFSVTLPAVFKTDAGLKAIFDRFKDDAIEQQRVVMMKRLPLQMAAMADAYSRAFPLSELKQIHAFALTPAGSDYLSKSLSLIGDPAVANANKQTIAEIQAATQALLPAFKEKAMAYLKAHPEVAAKIDQQAK